MRCALSKMILSPEHTAGANGLGLLPCKFRIIAAAGDDANAGLPGVRSVNRRNKQ